jgi:hypothetical protein
MTEGTTPLHIQDEATALPAYIFSGFPSFLEAAATELGLPNSAGPARRITALTDLANLCAQAAHGDPSNVEAILVKASGFRDQIAVALRASELMLAEVEACLGLSAVSEPDSGSDPECVSASTMVSRPPRKGIKHERVSS